MNYSIGRSGDGGNRTVALEIPETADDTERTIAEGKIAQQEANEAFLAENPGQTVEITTEDNIHCNGVYYPNGESHDWVIALHGYRGDHLGATSLAQHYYAHNYQVLTPDLRACGDTDGNYLGMGMARPKGYSFPGLTGSSLRIPMPESLFKVFPWVLPQP
ncbi:MAG: hypothetical protein ACLUD0_09260 [Eubacterium ramulus]